MTNDSQNNRELLMVRLIISFYYILFCFIIFYFLCWFFLFFSISFYLFLFVLFCFVVSLSYFYFDFSGSTIFYFVLFDSILSNSLFYLVDFCFDAFNCNELPWKVCQFWINYTKRVGNNKICFIISFSQINSSTLSRIF